MHDDRQGQIVTFYSYKGGTGRTMALANVAWILASNGRRVLAVDWDLDAPGLNKFFHPFLQPEALAVTSGVVDIIMDYQWAAIQPDERPADWHLEFARVRPHAMSLDWTFPDDGTLDFLSAGLRHRDYSAAVSSLDWDNFYDRLGGGQFFDALRADMKRNYDYTLIDSRTGLSDIADICTVHFPDVLVDCFTMSDQSIDGAATVARNINARYHDRNIRILPVPMRIEDGEKGKLDAGRAFARHEFDGFPAGLDADASARYWSDVEIPYRRFYAFEETLATFGDLPGSPTSLLAAFERLTSAITREEVTALRPVPEDVRRQQAQRFVRRQPSGPSDVVLRYAPEDRMWADWIATVLTRADFRVSLQASGPVGADTTPPFTGSREAVVYSAAFQRSAEGFAAGPGRVKGMPATPGDRRAEPLTPILIRVGDIRLTVPFATSSTADLTGLDEERAVEVLLGAFGPFRGDHLVPTGPVGARFPSSAPVVWNVATRNAAFTGRDEILERLRDQIVGDGSAVVLPQALYGLGGVGKTQVALEYAHRFKADYDVVWWVSCEEPGLLNPAFAQLATRLGLQTGENMAEAALAVRDALRQGTPYPRWLLIFDNAGDIAEIEPYLPGGAGHDDITSRNQAWSRVASPLEVDVFTRDESVEHLLRRLPRLGRPDAEKIAEALGDLPLAVEQAGAWLRETGMPAAEYIRQLETQLLHVLSLNQPTDYPLPVAATWNLSIDRLKDRSPASVRLLHLCAFFAAERISLGLVYSDEMAAALRPYDETLREKLVLGKIVQEIGRFGLAKVDQGNNSLQVHRLVQAITRSQLSADEQDAACHDVHTILRAARPRQGGADDPVNWPSYDEIGRHIRPSRAIARGDAPTRQMLIEWVRYLGQRFEFEAGLSFARELEAVWGAALGPDNHDLLHLRFEVGNLLRLEGRFAEAREYNSRTLDRQRAVLGEDHPYTLMTAGGLAADLRALGEFHEALELARQTYEKFKELFGEDHQSTLLAANNLAVSLRLVGDCFGARELDVDTLERRRVVLGEFHPYTLYSAANLARDLREAGEYAESARRLRLVYDQCQQALDEYSLDTLRTATSLAISLRKSGSADERDEAKRLTERTYEKYVARYGRNIPDVLACALNRACDLYAADERAAARDLAAEVRRQYETNLGPRHPYTLVAANNHAIYLRGTGTLEEAAAVAGSTRETLRHNLGNQHPFTLSCSVNLANCLADRGDLVQAAAIERQTIAALLEKYGRSHPDTLAAQANHILTLGAASRESVDRLAADPAAGGGSLDGVLAEMERVLGAHHRTVEAVRQGERISRDLDPQPT